MIEGCYNTLGIKLAKTVNQSVHLDVEPHTHTHTHLFSPRVMC